MVEEEGLVLLDVVRDDAQVEVPLSGERAAIEHLGPVADRALELGERIAPLGVEAHVHVDHHVEAERRAVEQGDPALDHAVLLELLDASPAGRIRKSELGRDVGCGLRAVPLQLVENAPIGGIQIHGMFLS